MKLQIYLIASMAAWLASWPCSLALALDQEGPRGEAEMENREGAERSEARAREADLERARELDRLRDQLRELKAAGKIEEAAELRRHLAEVMRQNSPEEPRLRREAVRRENLEAEIAELHRQGRHEEAERLEREWAGREELRRPEAPPPEGLAQLQHLRVAIEHLHLAGLHEPADHLERQAQDMEAHLHRDRMAPEEHRMRMEQDHALDALHEGLNQLRAELEETRQALRRLHAQMAELKRERHAEDQE